MSGVAKDDTNPNSPPEDTVAAVDAAEAGQAESPATSQAESEARASRRVAPHLRVVTDNDPDFVPPAAASEAPHQRIGTIIRAARESAGFSLDQVSKETRVHLSHLRAIEDMTPGLLGAPVYAKGYIRAYARFLGMDEQTTLDRYLSECAILKDPEKQEIAPPASSKSRKLPVAIPVLGILIVALVGAAGVFFLANGDKTPVVAEGESQTAAGQAAQAAAAGVPVAQRFTIVALKRAMLEVRSAKGDKYVRRYFDAGESYPVRVGANWTVSVEDGAAFEWRMGDQSLGLVQAEGGPVYNTSVDIAAQRPPVVIEAPPVVTPDPADAAYATPPATGTTNATPPAPKPRAPKPQTSQQPAANPPAIASVPPAVKPPVVQPTQPAKDPALAAYPDQ